MKNSGKQGIKTICLAISLIVFCAMFSGCYDKREVDELAYVVAMGMDKGKTNFLRLTLQIAVPTAIGGGGGEGGGGGGGGTSEASTITTLEAPTLYAAIKMANMYISKELNMSHCKLLVISEELAREGIQKYLHAIIRGREFRPNMFVAVSRGTAQEYLENVKPTLEINPAKYYELNYGGYSVTGFTAYSTLIRFYLQTECTCVQPVATLAGVTDYKDVQDFDLQRSTYKEKGRPYPFPGDFKAGDMPDIGKDKSEIMGLAAFDAGKMVGELDGEEAMYHLMLTGEFQHASITFPDPLVKDDFVIMDVKTSRRPRYKVEMIDGKPRLYAKVILEADIQSIQSGKNYENPKNLSILENSVENYLEKGMLRYLERTAKEFGTDLCGFGKDLKRKFLVWQEWIDFNWLEKYKDSTFTVDVDLKVRRPGLIIRTMPSYSTEGEEIE